MTRYTVMTLWLTPTYRTYEIEAQTKVEAGNRIRAALLCADGDLGDPVEATGGLYFDEILEVKECDS